MKINTEPKVYPHKKKKMRGIPLVFPFHICIIRPNNFPFYVTIVSASVQPFLLG